MSRPPEALLGDDLAPVTCPVCSGSLEAVRSQRMIPVGGRWRAQGEAYWSVRCANAHQGTGRSLEAAVHAVRRP